MNPNHIGTNFDDFLKEEGIMTDKQIIIDETKCPWFNDGSCDLFYSDKEECWYRKCKDTPNCYYRETQTQLKAKEQEYEELRQYHNKCCEENAKKLEEWLKKFNQVSKDFYNGKYCDKENCNLLKAKEQECEELKKELEELKEENEYNEANAIEFKQTLVEICLNVETLRLNIGGIEIMWNNNPQEWQDDILQDFATCRRLIQEIQQKISECEANQ